MKYLINGKFFLRKVSGQERFARELLKKIDELADENEFGILIPNYAKDVPIYKRIRVIQYGELSPILWEQIELPIYAYRNKCKLINLCTSCPVVFPGITVIHDICQVVNKEFVDTLYTKLSNIYYGIMRWAVLKTDFKILTVSNFSKREIINWYHIPENRVKVLGNGWDHIKRVIEDDSALEFDDRIKKGNYFFSASSLSPQKNFLWVKRVARLNPDELFVVSGKKLGLTRNSDNVESQGNIIYLGYVNDSQMKSLMKHCKAFIHPALYEGFGITPLEALSLGAKVIVSNRASLPEIYRNCAYYIDPYDYNVDLNKLLMQSVEPPDEVLSYYTWKKMARRLMEILRSN